MEAIHVNLATFEYQDKRFAYPMLLGAAIILLLMSWLTVKLSYHYQNTIFEYETRIQHLEQKEVKRQKIKEESKQKLAEGEAASIQKDIDFVNDLIIKDIFPWGRLLNTLEVKMPNGVILENFTTSKDFTKVQLKGSAELMKNIGLFLTNLDEALIYRDNRLINLSIDQEDIPQDDMDNTSMPIKYEIESTIDLEQLLKR